MATIMINKTIGLYEHYRFDFPAFTGLGWELLPGETLPPGMFIRNNAAGTAYWLEGFIPTIPPSGLTWSFEVYDNGASPYSSYIFNFTMAGGESLYECCEKENPMYLEWINRAGGRSTYTVDLRRIFRITEGETSRWRDFSGTDKVFRKAGKKIIIEASAEGDPQQIIDIVRSMKLGIQAWILGGPLNDRVPVIIDDAAFIYADETDTLGYNMRIEIGSEIVIQRQ